MVVYISGGQIYMGYRIGTKGRESCSKSTKKSRAWTYRAKVPYGGTAGFGRLVVYIWGLGVSGRVLVDCICKG